MGSPFKIRELFPIALLSLASCAGEQSGEERPGSDHASSPNLSEHPIYRTYSFGSSDNVVDIGTQPLWVPTCLISEAMRHDNILRDALSERGLEVRFHAFLKGADVNFFLERGELEVAIGGDMPALFVGQRDRNCRRYRPGDG